MNVGHPPGPNSFIDEKTVSIVRNCQSVGAAGPESEEWMEGPSAAELLMHFGIDPNVVISLDGKMRTPEGISLSQSRIPVGHLSRQKAAKAPVPTIVVLPMLRARRPR